MQAWFNHLLNFLRRWWVHLGEAAPVWIATTVPVGITLFMWSISRLLALSTEQFVRFSGGLLELAGVCTIALGLRDTRKLFERPSFRDAVRDWFGTIPRWRSQHHVQVGSGVLTLRPGSVQGYGTVTSPAESTVEQRIAALESEVKNLSGRIQATREEFDSKITEQKNALAAEQRERKEHVAGTRRLIDEAVAGGLVVEATGLIWLVIGLVLATTSAEIAQQFSP